MEQSPGRRERKKQQTRQTISDVATHLFLARGFDPVTIAEIATAADVAVQTVFNHFPTKEDLFFDDLHWVDGPPDALRAAPGQPPVATLEADYRAAVRRMDDRGYLATAAQFARTITASTSLQARRAHYAGLLTERLVLALLDTGAGDRPRWQVELLAARYAATRRVLDAELVRLAEEVGVHDAVTRMDAVISTAFASLDP